MSTESPRQTLSLGDYADAVRRRLQEWQQSRFSERLWAKDPTLWFEDPQPEISDRLGWLDLPTTMHAELPALRQHAESVREEGFQHVVLLGMGGSSLAPEVYQRTFGNAGGYPELLVLDSTHPEAVLAVAHRIDPAATLFVVSSKSGTTLETLSGFRFCWQLVSEASAVPGAHFVAVTDSGSSLEELATDRGFRAVFSAPSDVGGRYSAFTHFGLVPASLIGLDVEQLLERAAAMVAATAADVPETSNPALELGAAMGELALAGRDKLTYVVSPSLAAFPDWLEQLVAESTGKDGTGIIPVAGEILGSPDECGADRFFVHLAPAGDDDDLQEEQLAALEDAGHPVARISLTDRYDLAAEMLRAELATAAAGAVLGIHPFNQPDVQLAKKLAQEAMEGSGAEHEAPAEVGVDTRPQLTEAVQAWLSTARDGDYLAIQAYLAAHEPVTAALRWIGNTVRRRHRIATTLGYGPRFLHSTGQLHKGGSNTGLFLQLVDAPVVDVDVPETGYSFGDLIAAQAVGDYRAMQQRRRRVLRVNLGGNVIEGLGALQAAFRD